MAKMVIKSSRQLTKILSNEVLWDLDISLDVAEECDAYMSEESNPLDTFEEGIILGKRIKGSQLWSGGDGSLRCYLAAPSEAAAVKRLQAIITKVLRAKGLTSKAALTGGPERCQRCRAETSAGEPLCPECYGEEADAELAAPRGRRARRGGKQRADVGGLATRVTQLTRR